MKAKLSSYLVNFRSFNGPNPILNKLKLVTIQESDFS